MFISVEAVSQNYTPLLGQTNEWQLTSCYEGDCFTDIYFTNGDTIVNNLDYQILDGYHYINRNFLLREEVSEKKVFVTVILPNRVEEFLLYDFSLNVGDSIQIRNPITPFFNNAGFFELDSIENVTQDNQEYRFFHLSPTENNEISSNNIVWIEGMGSLSIINAPSGVADINGVGKVSCYFKNGNLFYHDPNGWGNNCTATLSSETNEWNSLFVTFPEKKQIRVHHAETLNQVAWFDISGKLIHTQKINSASTHLFDLHHLNSGFYVMQCFSNQGFYQYFKVVLE